MMSSANRFDRRTFLGTSLAAVTAGTAALNADSTATAPASQPAPGPSAGGMPYGTIGKVKISRLMLGGNLVGGFMHCRDLHYVNELFRAYVTEEKLMQTFKLAEEHGINTVFETGGPLVQRYNQRYGGHMQNIPSIHPALGQSEQALKDEIKEKVDSGVPAVYVWGVAGDALVKVGEVGRIARAVELAKTQGLPTGVGGHSLQVPLACEKAQVPCDFYVKTLHRDDYPSALPKELRKDWIWLEGGKGWNDNMWCLDPEETIAVMEKITKPWIAFKILAAGAIQPQRAFGWAFRNGADFIAVGMFDFQVKQDCEVAVRAVERAKDRPRPWRA
jgi:hypothetical protein